MHKKYNKFNHKDHHHSSTKKTHMKCKKDSIGSALEVPQNSRSDINRKIAIDTGDAKENCKRKHKHKHRKSEEAPSNSHHAKSKHEKKFDDIANVEEIVLDNDAVNHKEKKEKREKERLNKIEKYLEGLDKARNKKISHKRSHSLGSSESVLKNREILYRREKTFHEKLKRNASTNSHIDVSEVKELHHSTNTQGRKSNKKHKHKESKERESSKEKNTKDVSYCQVETQNPFLHKKKKYDVERLYPEESNIFNERSSRRRSSSRDSHSSPQTKFELNGHRDKNRESLKKKVAPIKFSPRRSKLKADLKNYKDERSNASLGPYRKYFAFDKKNQMERETTHNRKKKHRKVESEEKTGYHENKKEKKNEIKSEKSKKKQEKVDSESDQYKEKIEDDIKSYFTKIQSLIDKKLDFILGNSSSKETKTSSADNAAIVEKTKSKKHKKAKIEGEHLPPDPSSLMKKKIVKHNASAAEKKDKYSEETMKAKHSGEKRVNPEINRESKRLKNARISSTSLRRERYPSADSRNHKRHRSMRSKSPYDNNFPSDTKKEIRQERRSKSPYHPTKDSKMKPDQLINMLEHPSSFSLQSRTSLVKEIVEDKPNPRSYQTQRDRIENEYHHRRNKSPTRDDLITNYENFKIKELEQAFLQEAYVKKMKKRTCESPFTVAVQSSAYLTKEQLESESKYKPDGIHMCRSDANGHYQKRDRSPTKKFGVPDEENAQVKELERNCMQEIHNKKMRKRARQMMNLECKTVSIVGIPSQLRESTIFNETQTTTSLNVINNVEDFIEKKKNSKRFKLYYKYSVADNKCQNDSDKSSEGKKSIISDSCKIVTDPSDHNLDTWEDNQSNDAIKGSADADLAKILFVMNNKKFRKKSEVTGKHTSVERPTKKYRKRGDSPKPSVLNNILEEPSNISIVVRRNEVPVSLNEEEYEDVDCTFFKALKSSSSDCDLELFKKNDHNRHTNRHVQKYVKETKPKSPSRRDNEKNRLYEEGKSERKPKHEEKYESHKKMEIQQRIKKRHATRNMYKFTSKSDINISYDSLTKYKYNDKKGFDTAKHLREELRHLLPDLPVRKPSPEKKSFDLILKEELRQILKEIPRSMACKETSFDDLGQTEEPKSSNKCPEDEIHESKAIVETESSENKKTKQTEEKKCCSKKIGTHPTMTKIPSLIKGYIAKTASQSNTGDAIKNNSSTKQLKKDVDVQDEDEGENPNEREQIDTGTEIDIATEENMAMEETAEIVLENKMSQTPTIKIDAGIEVAMDKTIQSRSFKKPSTAKNFKRCQILDPFTNTKAGCTVKPTRPIINLENTQFPNLKEQDISRPTSQYKRQKTSMSEGRGVKFQNREELEACAKELKQRPTSVDKDTLDKRGHKKSALTIKTNVITINPSAYTERNTDRHEAQMKSSKKSVISDSSKQYTWDKRASSAGYEKRTHEKLSSKSALSLNDVSVESKIGSLVCVDNFNYRKMNMTSNSNCRSLDQYTMKSIDNPHSSRLFLTKSFSPQMNTYQRRKMYDETIRKKMKKKYKNQNQMGPKIYEVRYLTLENDNLNENFDENQSPVGNHKSSVKLPTFGTKINKSRQRGKTSKASVKKTRKNFPLNKEDACKFSGRDIFAPLISDVDQLNKFRRKAFPEKQVEEIYVKDGKEKKGALDDKHSSSATTDDKCISAEHLNSTTINKEAVDQNFKELIDCLYNSIISYCNSKFNLPGEKVNDTNRTRQTPDSQTAIQGRIGDRKPELPLNEISYVILPESPQAKRNRTQPINTSSVNNATFKKNSSSEGKVSNEEQQSKRSTNIVCGHLSCPVLAGSTSSFDYLYEDGSIGLNKEAVLLHFRKPMKTILGYALNNTSRIHKEVFLDCLKKEDQISNSATESEESGYSSNTSKKCTSVCSFFKKPSIVNLFKPVKKLEEEGSISVADSRSGPNLQEYDIMNQKCIEYAEKVRIQSQHKDLPEETFQEIPLDVLLFCKKSYTRLGDFNSNCSLCKKHSNSNLPEITELDEMTNSASNLWEEKNSLNFMNLAEENKSIETSSDSKIQTETLIFYNDVHHRPSVEVISIKKSETNFTNDDQLIKEMAQCPVVLSITNLNTYSLTVIEEPAATNTLSNQTAHSQDMESDVAQRESNHVTVIKEQYSSSDLKSSVQDDLDSRSDTSSNSGFRHINSPSITSKYMAKRFFDNLLKVYEKEMYITNKLFKDEEFFSNTLLESIKSAEVTKTTNIKLKKLIKRKIRNCIGNVFSSKNGLNRQNGPVDAQTTSFMTSHQRKLKILASDARQYFSMYVQAVQMNKDINDEVKICGLLKLLERIEDGDFAVLRRKEDVDFEEEIKEQVKDAFITIYQISVKEAKKRKRSLTTNDLKLIRTFVSKYRIGLLSKTDLIASYIGRGVFKTEEHLKAAVTYLIQQTKNKDIDLGDFDQHCSKI